MYKEIYSYDMSGKKYISKLKHPEECPHCKQGLEPFLVRSTVTINEFEYPEKLCNTYYCRRCNSFFLGMFITEASFNPTILWQLAYVIPDGFKKYKFSDEIFALSSRFSDIFNQAAQAESLGLSEICGMGYRKALEVLVKDYSIHLNQSDKDKILKLPLSKCINEYIDDDDLKNIATASAWLGNDETHYTRKLEGIGLKELKSFLESMISFIEFKCRAQNAKSIIDNKNL